MAFLLASLLLTAVIADETSEVSRISAQATSAGSGRLMPPVQIPCEASSVTVYNGRVTSYRRTRGKTTLRIRTDFGTTETVTLRHPGMSDPSKSFLLLGAPFRGSHWKRIEVRRGVLRKGMRAHAWVCTSGPALVDWRPGETPAGVE